MRPRSLFLNLSRGFVVDDVALKKHLDSGHIAGAALDVYPVEPKANGEEFEPRWFRKSKHPITGEEFWEFTHEYWDVREDVAQGKKTWDQERLEEVF